MTTFTTYASATFATGNIVVVESADNMFPGLPITFSGNTFGGITVGSTYYIGNITYGFPTSNITLTSLPGGAVFALANGSGNMTATFSQGGQNIIPTVPPGEPLNEAFDAINVNFDQIWAAGPVGSNIQIDNNTILTLNTNGNLVLNPNGIGNVIANAHVIPDQDRVRNLGAFALRWNTVYAQNFVGNGGGISNITVSNISNGSTNVTALANANVTVTVAGNANVAVFTPDSLLITGTVSSSGNITAPTFIGNLVGNITGNIDAGGNDTEVQFNDNNLLAGSPGFTFDKNTNAVGITGTVTAGNVLTGGAISAVGNITANYYFGNGSQLTGITADNVNADDLIGNVLSGNVLYSNLITVGNLVSLSVTGNTTTGNLNTTGLISAAGNVIGGNILFGSGIVSGTGNIYANKIFANIQGNIDAAGNLYEVQFNTIGDQLGASANFTYDSANNVLTVNSGNIVGGNVSAVGNISATYFFGNGSQLTGIDATSIQNGNSNVRVSANANVTVGVAGVSNVAVFTSTGLEINGVVSATGNIDGNNINAVEQLSGNSLSIANNAVIGGNLTVNGNIVYINITELNVEDPIIGLGRGPNNTPLTTNDGKDRGEQLWYFDDIGNVEKSAFTGYDNSTGKIIAATDVTITNEIVAVNNFGGFVAGNIESESLSALGNITGGNILFGSGIVSGTGNIYANKIFANIQGNIDAAGNLYEVQFNGTGDALSANANFTYDSANNVLTVNSGNIVGGNITIGGLVSAVGNVYGSWFVGNVDATIVSATANITGGNLLTVGLISASGSLTAANISGNNLFSTGVVSATGNVHGSWFVGNVDATVANVSGNIDAGNVVSQGIVTANAGVYGDIYTTSIDSADSSAIIVTPDMILLSGLNVNQDITVGNIVIPSYGNITVGNVRIANLAEPIFNQDAATKRYVDSAIGNVLPVITNQTINPDGSSLTYTLNQSTTAVGIFVTINGIAQTPNDSYTVVANQITFAEALLTTDVVQVRFLSGATNSGIIYSVDTLPTASGAGPGARAFVNDSNTTVFYSNVGNSGSNFVPVFSDGTSWRVG